MSEDEIYLAIVDKVVERLDKQQCKTREEVENKIAEIETEYTEAIERALNEICNDYCKIKELDEEEQ